MYWLSEVCFKENAEKDAGAPREAPAGPESEEEQRRWIPEEGKRKKTEKKR